MPIHSGDTQRYPFKHGRFSSHAAISRLAGPGLGRDALDVGCGSGLVAELLSENGWIVDGIEANAEMAADARARCRSVIEADVLELDVTQLGLHDMVLFGDVLEHLADPLALLRSWRSAVRPNGFMIISVPNVAHAFIRMNLLMGRFTYTERGILDRTHLRFFTQLTFAQLLLDAGLRIVDLEYSAAPIEELIPTAQDGGRLSWLQGVGGFAAKRAPRLFAYQFVVKVTPVSDYAELR